MPPENDASPVNIDMLFNDGEQIFQNNPDEFRALLKDTYPDYQDSDIRNVKILSGTKPYNGEVDIYNSAIIVEHLDSETGEIRTDIFSRYGNI